MLPEAAIDALVKLFEDAVADGVHQLDPVERQKTMRARIAEESAKWPAIDPGSVVARSNALEQAALSHPGIAHVQPIAPTAEQPILVEPIVEPAIIAGTKAGS